MAGGIAAFDFNNDGRLDLFFTNGAELPGMRKTGPSFFDRLYRNDGSGHFTDVSEDAGVTGSGYNFGAAAADFDNDGFPDLFVAGFEQSHLYRNVGGKHFEDVTLKSGIQNTRWSIAAGWFDYDGDGLLDLFVVNYVKWSPALNPRCTDPSGKYTVYCNPAKFAATANTLYRNRGGGRFEDVSVSSGIAKSAGKGMSLAIADYDRDGYPDVFVTNDILPNFLFHNLKNGRFDEVAFDAGVALPDNGSAISGMGADFRDYDNDGRPDIVFTALEGQTFPLFRNVGSGQFQEVTQRTGLARISSGLSGWGVALRDFDNDGWKDLFSANSHVTDNIELFSGDRYKLPNSLFENRRGTFVDSSNEAGSAFRIPRAHRGLVAADFDNDGSLDAVVSVLGEKPEFWRNEARRSSHWLELKLIDSVGNRDAIGAVVHIANQWNEMTSTAGYASSCLAPVHFGLGETAVARRIEITWPDGALQILNNVKADQRITVKREKPRPAAPTR